jgi:hypothetical protein
MAFSKERNNQKTESSIMPQFETMVQTSSGGISLWATCVALGNSFG